jgi:tetratricopeptide (TPR) repeat protein
MYLFFYGRWEESIPEYKKAIRLNPIPPNAYLWSLGLSYCWTRQYEEAITWSEKAVHKEPDSFFVCMMMAVFYNLSGREEQTRAEASEILRINPKFSVDKYEKNSHTRIKMIENSFLVPCARQG